MDSLSNESSFDTWLTLTAIEFIVKSRFPRSISMPLFAEVMSICMGSAHLIITLEIPLNESSNTCVPPRCCAARDPSRTPSPTTARSRSVVC